MKRLSLTAGLLCSSLLPLLAQVTVEIAQDQDQFLPGENLPVAVRITNRSGQTLAMGAEEDWLSFAVESRDGTTVTKLGDVPVAGKFLLESSKAAVKRLDLAPYFSFSEPGRYFITATVRIRNWDHDIASRPRFFDIIEGAKLWEQEVGVPPSGNSTNATPEVRRYMLQQANYMKGQLRLYLRLIDSSGRTTRVLLIGPMLSFSRPEPQIDKMSNLHLLYQNGPHAFSYTVHNTDGELLMRQTYDYVNARPRLEMQKEGVILVAGGIRRLSSSDFPPAPTATTAADETPGAPPPSVPAKTDK